MVSLLAVSFHPSLAMGQFFFLEDESVGKPAKDFTLKTVGGAPVSLTDFRQGGKAVIFFWATWCPHCRRELTELNRNKAALEQKGIKIVLVDVGEEEEAVRRYAQSNNIGMTIFLDESNSVSEEYGLVGVPTFYLVDKEGIVRDVQHAMPEDYEAMLENAPIVPEAQLMPEVLGKTTVKAEAPSQTAIWTIALIVMLFLGILAKVFLPFTQKKT
jgi:peroxiredoxin